MNDPLKDALLEGLDFQRIANIGVKAAQGESRRLGVPNVYSIDGKIYYELPNGELSLTDPYVKPLPQPADVAPPATPNSPTHPSRG